MTNRVVIPLDGISREKALQLADTLKGLVWGFKVNDLLIDEGVSIIKKLREFGNVFADPKLHDIPNTVANGVLKLSAAGANLITIHASGGLKMIEAAVKATAGRSKILCITALTSLSDQDTSVIYGRNPEQTVVVLAGLALRGGAYGIVCSPQELPAIQGHQDLRSLAKIVPGIRPSWYGTKDDQARISTPREALNAGADLLVIGRPITEDTDPRKAAQRVIDELNAKS